MRVKRAGLGFTLVEVVVALVVASLIAGATVAITKNKMENAVAYYYYAVYTTLQAAVDELMRDNTKLSDDICPQLADKLNTIKTGCGSTHAGSVFTEDNAQIILRSGARLYMEHISPVVESEYTPYWSMLVDINGDRGKGELGKDVFPFDVLVTGTVVPQKVLGQTAGGTNPKHLAVDVKYDVFENGVRTGTAWLLRNVSFQEAVCKSGNYTGQYCDTITKDAICTHEADCRIVPVKPSPIGH